LYQQFAILDGNWITAVRTAGLSSVAATRLANPDSRSVGLIGCGVQARSHLKAFAELFPLEQVLLFGRGGANMELTTQTAKALDLGVKCCETAREAIETADIVVTSINYSADSEGFVDANWLKPGAFSAIPDLGVSWIKDTYAVLDILLIDDVNQEKTMGAPLAEGQRIDGDLNDLVLGRLSRPINLAARSAFVFRGQSIGDLALSALAWQLRKTP
jgi:ornithine cyclodeaminase/alanine dehydrogenase